MVIKRWWAGLLGAALLLGGCAAPASMRSDLDRVRSLSRVEVLPQLQPGHVDAEAAEDVQALLEKPLGADEAVRVALLNNRALRADLRMLGVARGRLVQAGLLPNPEIEVDLRRSHDPNQRLQGDFMVEYDLTRALLTPLRRGVAEAELQAARTRSALAVVQTGYQVRRAFREAQGARQQLAAATRSLDSLATARDLARALSEAGNLPELDRASQEAAYEDARARVAEVELRWLDQRERLQQLLGLYGPLTGWDIEPALPALPVELRLPENLEQRVLTASLDVKEARHRLEAIARKAGLARTEGSVPDVSVDAHAEQDGRAWEVGGGLRMRLPFFDRKQGTVMAGEAEFDAEMERLQGLAIQLRSEARQLHNRLRSTHLRAQRFSDTIVPARRKVMEQTQLQYNAMQVGLFQLLRARRELLDAETSAIQTQVEFWTTQAALDALLTGARVEASAPKASSASAPSDGDTGGH